MIGFMLENGMDIARIDLSMGSHEDSLQLVEALKKSLKIKTHHKCAVMVDLQGSQIRTLYVKDGQPAKVKKNQTLKVVSNPEVRVDDTMISTNMVLPLRAGEKFFIDDGGLELEVVEAVGDEIKARVLNNYELKDLMAVNLTGEQLDQLALEVMQRDELDIKEVVMKVSPDIISIPNVRKPEDVQKIREILGQEGEIIKLFARIESLEGIENYEQIMQICDGIVVMRGALGCELADQEKLFVAQKWMIERANVMGKTIVIGS